MKITDFFQKGYYINLDSRPERREAFEKEVAKYGLENFFERIPGVSDLTEANKSPLLKDKSEDLKRAGNCSKAFHNVFKRIKQDKVERALVCEDDMYFIDYADQRGIDIAEKALDQIQKIPDWDMLYFGGHILDKEAKQVSENLIKVDRVLAMHAVGYNAKCIDVLLTFRPYFECVYDGWITYRTQLAKYVMYPQASIQREGPSDIDVTGKAVCLNQWLNMYNSVKIVK